MAKLEGVKVIDMVGGEVTKISYEAAEYAKIYGDAEVGDIAVLFDGHSVVGGDVGEFYPVVEGRKEPKIPTKYGGRINYVISKGYGAAFRKVSAPSIEDRVTAFESQLNEVKAEVKELKEGGGKVTMEISGNVFGELAHLSKQSDDLPTDFRKVDRGYISAGDYVKFTKTADDDITVGKYYVVNHVDSDGDPNFYDDVHDLNVGTIREKFDIYEKVVADEPLKQREYLPKPAQVGDKIVITDAYDDRYENGDEFTVKMVSGKSVHAGVNGELYIYGSEFEIIERPATKLQVGDYAKVIRSASGNYEGLIVKLTKDWGDKFPRFDVKSVTASDIRSCAGKDMVPATDEEVAEAKRKASPDLPAGTKVRGKSTGSIRTLTERFPANDSVGHGKAYLYAENSRDWIGDQQFEIVTDEEIAAHEHSKEIERREKLFTDAGRKVDEYREGDIVEFHPPRSNYIHALTDYPGIRTEISSVDCLFVDLIVPKYVGASVGSTTKSSHLKPVVFVENRLDK